MFEMKITTAALPDSVIDDDDFLLGATKIADDLQPGDFCLKTRGACRR